MVSTKEVLETLHDELCGYAGTKTDNDKIIEVLEELYLKIEKLELNTREVPQ